MTKTSDVETLLIIRWHRIYPLSTPLYAINFPVAEEFLLAPKYSLQNLSFVYSWKPNRIKETINFLFLTFPLPTCLTLSSPSFLPNCNSYIYFYLFFILFSCFKSSCIVASRIFLPYHYLASYFLVCSFRYVYLFYLFWDLKTRYEGILYVFLFLVKIFL